MRKTSQDGGDSTSITSGLGIMKSTRNSIKRKVQSLSHESDDGVIEPLLQKDKENTTPVAKFSIGKTKTDQTSDKGKDNQAFKVNLADIKPSTTAASFVKDVKVSNAPSVGGDNYRHVYSSVAPYRAYIPSALEPVSEQVLVSIDGSKTAERANSPLIFTTAKIHGDTKPNQTEQVRVTPSSSSKADIIDTKQTNNLQNIDKTPKENDKAVNRRQDVCKLGGSVSDNKIKESSQTPVNHFSAILETKTHDVNSTKGTGLPTDSTNITVNSLVSVRDSMNTIKAERTIKIESISDTKLENNQIHVNAKCVALQNVSIDQNKSENKIGPNIYRNDIDGIDINKNIQSKAMASKDGSLKSPDGNSTTKVLLVDKNDMPLHRQKTSSIEECDLINKKSYISSSNTAIGKISDDSKTMASTIKKSFDDNPSITKPATSINNKSNDSKPTISSSATTRSSTKTINVSAVSKTPSSNSFSPLGSTSKAVPTSATSSTTLSVAKSSKVSTVSTIHTPSQSGTQSKVGNKESATKQLDSKPSNEKERERNVVTHKT